MHSYHRLEVVTVGPLVRSREALTMSSIETPSLVPSIDETIRSPGNGFEKSRYVTFVNDNRYIFTNF